MVNLLQVEGRYMKAVVYLSKAKVNFSGPALVELCEFATSQNKKHDITGYLMFHQQYFLQYFEGQEADVDRLYSNICRDQRHIIVAQFEQTALSLRRFDDWKMKFISFMDVQRVCPESILIRLFEKPVQLQQQANDLWDVVASIQDQYRYKQLQYS